MTRDPDRLPVKFEIRNFHVKILAERTLKGSQITAQIDDLGGNFVFTDQIS
jgi:hypothetical protein